MGGTPGSGRNPDMTVGKVGTLTPDPSPAKEKGRERGVMLVSKTQDPRPKTNVHPVNGRILGGWRAP
jgi:hypothetical protein